jgi:hypothetical protein
MRKAMEAMQMNQENIPEKKFSTGVINATIWRNKGISKTGNPVEFRTVSLQRRYTDKNNEWKSTNSLRTNDLPKAILVLNKAYEHIVLKEQTDQESEEGVEVEEVE